jgi:hypothetical protein
MDRELNQINVIPLVDVMLVLLVIVLTTATFITTGQIPVDLAKAKERPTGPGRGRTQDCDECPSPGISRGRAGRSRDHTGQVRNRRG